jgi:hypothetical protein
MAKFMADRITPNEHPAVPVAPAARARRGKSTKTHLAKRQSKTPVGPQGRTLVSPSPLRPAAPPRPRSTANLATDARPSARRGESRCQMTDDR